MKNTYIKYFILLFCGLMAVFSFGAKAQTAVTAPLDSLAKPVYRYRVVKDSAFYARQKLVTDSILARTWLIPDSLLTKNMLLDSLVKARVYSRPAGDPWYTIYNKTKKQSLYKTGNPRPKGEVWILGFIAFLLILFAVLKNSFSKQLYSIVQSFFSNRILNNLNKEDNLFTSWPFLLLFILFGFIIGMFFYLVTQYYRISYGAGGFKFFLTISVMIVILYTFKIILLKLLGFLFNIQKPVHEYISILYLSYFNISIMFIPLVVAFALSPLRYGLYYIVISFILLIVIFAFQFIRAGVNILSHYRLSKIYLFLYFCALEICPILILIKAVGL